jgi:predicted acylesterase/phospholipase RssA
MLQHLLYIVSPSHLEPTQRAMERLNATPVEHLNSFALTYHLSHKLLGDLGLEITLLADLDGVAPHMRQHPVDLLVYDERGGGMEAVKAIKRLRKDVKSLGDLWGPDFYFPLSRVIAVVEGEDPRNHRTFELGRLNVRDVIVAPKSTARLLKWIHDVLYDGVIRSNRIGVALSGGGVEGFLYQVGMITALNRALVDRDLFEVDVISGISSGALAGTLLAAQIDMSEVIRSIHNVSTKIPHMKSQTLFDLAGTNIAKRLMRESLNLQLSPYRWMQNAVKAIPTGFFKGENLENYFHSVLESAGQPDDFEQLGCELYIGATDQDSFDHVTFGLKGWNKMPITEACRASCAFPLLFTPKMILGRRYIDGQVTKSCNLDVVVQRGCRLIFVIDPLKPARTFKSGAAEAEGGFFGAVQVAKALSSTRFEQDLRSVSSQYPDVDFIVFQPDEKCAELMAGSPMRYRIRTQIIEQAYKSTLRRLRDRYRIYQAKMARYGFHLCSPEELRELEKDYDQVFETPR